MPKSPKKARIIIGSQDDSDTATGDAPDRTQMCHVADHPVRHRLCWQTALVASASTRASRGESARRSQSLNLAVPARPTEAMLPDIYNHPEPCGTTTP